VVKKWGKNVSVLTDRPGELQVVPAPMGPGKTEKITLGASIQEADFGDK